MLDIQQTVAGDSSGEGRHTVGAGDSSGEGGHTVGAGGAATGITGETEAARCSLTREGKSK